MATMAMTSTSYAYSYHVFLSFRGLDTRYGFTGHLYKALTDKGIHTFIDDEELQRGREITPAIVKAIQESMIAIIVLSKHYASSSYCLDQLSTIIHFSQGERLQVIPVFYEVDPYDVRDLRGSYGDALTEHKRRFSENSLQKWKEALRQVANLSGYHFEEEDKYEYNFVGRIVGIIVDSVSNKINQPVPLDVADYPVGLRSRVAEVMKLLDAGSDDSVRMVGIIGMGGVGKSTLARAVYNNLIAAENFDGFCYLENVQEKSNKNGLIHLQNVLLQEVLRDKNIIKVTSVQQGSYMISDRLQQKKLLLVVDDVDEEDQLEGIVGRPEWFGVGSKVIIITRYQQLLVSHGVKIIYELKPLNEDDALRLLTWKALKTEKADPNHEKVLKRVLTYVYGHPLSLEVIGSRLFGKSVEEWGSVIKELNRLPSPRIQAVLRISFDGLEDKERSVFLDIACCLNGYELREVQDILGAHYGYSVETFINVLVDKSLVKLSHSIKPCYDTVILHELLEDMGKEIVRQESPRSRLWSPEDIIHVLRYNMVMGTTECEIIRMDVPEFDEKQIVEWDGMAFRNMPNLKTLIIRNCNFSIGPKCLPNSLRVLEWWSYPSHCLPSDFNPKELAICKLPCSRISKIELIGLLQKSVNLRVLKFSSPNEDT